jgi:hypothetical protein
MGGSEGEEVIVGKAICLELYGWHVWVKVAILGKGGLCSIHSHFTAPQTSVKDLGSYVPSTVTLQCPKRQ